MTEFYRIKSDKYITIANDFLKDKKLSNKSKGVLAMILALPDDWDFSFNGMLAIVKDGKSSLRSSINELRDLGYCYMEPVRINGKIARWKYFFTGDKSLLTDFQEVEKQEVENQPQYNNIINNISSINTPDKNIKNNIRARKPELSEEEVKFIDNMKKQFPRMMKMEQPLTLEQAKKLKDKYDHDLLFRVMSEIENWKPLLQKRVNAYKTIITWCDKELARS